jgi:hypothetical protein
MKEKRRWDDDERRNVHQIPVGRNYILKMKRGKNMSRFLD